MISIKLFIQQIPFHPTHFLSFFVLDSFDHFFHPTICKNDVILLQSNVKLDIKDSNFYFVLFCFEFLSKKKTNRSFGAKMADESMNSDSSLDSVDESIISSLTIVEYAPSSLLLFSHSLVFPGLAFHH